MLHRRSGSAFQANNHDPKDDYSTDNSCCCDIFSEKQRSPTKGGQWEKQVDPEDDDCKENRPDCQD